MTRHPLRDAWRDYEIAPKLALILLIGGAIVAALIPIQGCDGLSQDERDARVRWVTEKWALDMMGVNPGHLSYAATALDSLVYCIPLPAWCDSAWYVAKDHCVYMKHRDPLVIHVVDLRGQVLGPGESMTIPVEMEIKNP